MINESFKYSSRCLEMGVKKQNIIDSGPLLSFNIKLILKRIVKSTEHELSIRSEWEASHPKNLNKGQDFSLQI